MKSKYDWMRYNRQRNNQAIKIFKYNFKNKVNFFERGLYNHVRDLYAFSIIIASKPYFKKTVKILDYGGNLISNSNLFNKIVKTNTKINIYNPFSKEKNLSFQRTNIQISKKFNNIKNLDLTYFGSVLQYFDELSELNGNLTFLKSKYILITHTPINLSSKIYKIKQKNAKKLYQKIHSLDNISNILLKKKFTLVFKSINNFKYSGISKQPPNTYLLNLLYKKK